MFVIGLYSMYRPMIDIVMGDRNFAILLWYTVYRDEGKLRKYIVIYERKK